MNTKEDLSERLLDFWEPNARRSPQTPGHLVQPIHTFIIQYIIINWGWALESYVLQTRVFSESHTEENVYLTYIFYIFIILPRQDTISFYRDMCVYTNIHIFISLLSIWRQFVPLGNTLISISEIYLRLCPKYLEVTASRVYQLPTGYMPVVCVNRMRYC